MGKIMPLYSSQRAEEELARLEFERASMENSEYFVTWVASTLGLSSEQEQKAREIIGMPKGRFDEIQRRIRIMEQYTQPTMLGGNK
ncbi:MAG: hypothetical protein Q7S06_02170 [Nanoarchaeota archaeon]|nr:hypothetical protein [Nanoarchaeota archaeon]